MPRPVVLALLPVLGAFACQSDPADEDERGVLLDQIHPLLPDWDLDRLTVPLAQAMADCSIADLAAGIEILACHQAQDVGTFCPGNEENCRVELSDECAAQGEVSAACADLYLSYVLADRTSRIATIDDCDESREGLVFAAGVYERDVASYMTTNLSSFTLHGVYQGGAEGGQALLASAGDRCVVAFKGTDSSTDVWADVGSIVLTDCTTARGVAMGQCGSGFFTQYQAVRDTGGLLAALKARLDAGGCTGGLSVYGHSLGGAEASLFAAEMELARPTLAVKTYTYGEPRTFATVPADRYQTRVPKVRWDNWGDPVPNLPGSSFGFKHFATSARQLYVPWAAYYSSESTTVIFEVSQDYPANGSYGSASYPPNHYTTAYGDRLADCK